MKYFATKLDSNGFIYSIDNCIFEYTLRYPALKDDLITYLYELQSNHKLTDEFWTRLNLTPCSHWSWCSDVCHLCNGIYLSIGKYNYVKSTDTPVYVPVVKLEVNLNKHSDKDVLSDLLHWLKEYCISCYLIKYDLAIDISRPKEDIEIFGSKKERGLYKGTRYFGQRNEHGYVKIYDKAKEQGLDDQMTRVEFTLKYKEKMRFEDFYVKENEIKATKEEDKEKVSAAITPVQDSKKENDISAIKASTTDKAIINMLSALVALGESADKYINQLDFRQRKKIRELLAHASFKKCSVDSDLVLDLLEEVRRFVPFQDPPVYYYEDPDGFLKVDDTCVNLPF